VKYLPVLALLPILAVPVPAALAQQDARQCTAIAADAERLACFDAAFATADRANGEASIVLESQQLIPARPTGRAPATITIACTDEILSVAFAFAGNTISALGRDAGLTWQLDLGTRTSRTLPVDESNTALLLDNTRDALAFLRSLEGANNLTVRVTPASSRTLSVRYELAPLRELVAPVLAACGV
jgi:hypothetical protein